MEDLEHIDHFNGMRNGATVTGEYSSFEDGVRLVKYVPTIYRLSS